jgi:hypothetical protein
MNSRYVFKVIFLIFIFAPCTLISPKFFIHQQMQFLLILENSKIYIKTYIKTASTCLGLRPSSGSLQLSLAKVKLMLTYIKTISKITSFCHNTA